MIENQHKFLLPDLPFLVLLHFCTPYCYWWLMKKRGWKLYHSPDPNPRGVRKCNSTQFLIKLQEEVWKFNISGVLELSKNCPEYKLFKLKNRNIENVSLVTFKWIFDILLSIYFFNWTKEHPLKTSIKRTQV